MSYPSITKVLESQELNLQTSSESALRNALYEALKIDLPVGLEYLDKFAAKVGDNQQICGDDIDPNSLLGKQIIRIVGCDIPRSIVEEKTGVYFGMYNCCKVEARRGDKPVMDIRLQLQGQFTANC